ncbi:MAG: TlpA disulfide reductase family protein [Bacteroidales bacterium]
MKKLGFVILIFTILYACTNESKSKVGFLLEGQVSAFGNGYIYLVKRNGNEFIALDSVKTSQGIFKFSGKVESPEVYYLFFGDKKHHKSIFVENSVISVTGNLDSLDKAMVTGSKSHEELKKYEDELLPFDNKVKDLFQQFEDAESAQNKTLMHQIDSTILALGKEKQVFIKNYIITHRNSPVIPFVLSRDLAYSLDSYELDSLITLLNPNQGRSVYMKLLKQQLANLKNTDVGKPVPELLLYDDFEKKIYLSSFKGKLILLDFWASWCKECRMLNPEKLKLYNEYRNRNFQIVSISLDENRDKWIESIRTDEMKWVNVSDLKAVNSEVFNTFGIREIPYFVLIDSDGIILSKQNNFMAIKKQIDEKFKY